FSSVLLQSVEGLGLCGFGEAPAYLADVRAGRRSGPWINPGGGMLRRGYLHGLNNIVDTVRALRQLAETTGRVAVRDPSALVVSGGMSSGSALLLGDPR